MSVRGHHVRGAIGGLLLGVALSTMLTLYGVIRLGEFTAAWIVVAGLLFGVVWSFVAPVPRPKEQPVPEPE